MKSLIGKTIVNAEYVGMLDYDDKPWLYLTFSDGSEFLVESNYGGYTGNSADEYPCFLRFEWTKQPSVTCNGGSI